MIKNVGQNEASSLLNQLRVSQAVLDRIPELASAAARLSTVIAQIEDWASEQIINAGGPMP